MSARWRLASGHYIHVLTPDGTSEGEKSEWEYTEQNRDTGRMIRRRFPVPKLLDPRDPADWNYQNQIVVADTFDERFPQDYVMSGEPTPDMIPLNKAAKEISDKLAGKWQHPIDSLPGQFSASLLQNLEAEFSKALAAGMMPQAQARSVPNSEVEDLKKLVAQQGEMIAKLMGDKIEPKSETKPEVLEPLPEIKDPDAPLPVQTQLKPPVADDEEVLYVPPPVVAPYADGRRAASTPPKRI